MKIVFFMVAFFVAIHAATFGEVIKVEGIVKVQHKGSIKKQKVKAGYKIQEGDIISTYRKALAVLKLHDNSKIVLDEKSTISFRSNNEVAQNSGKIYYKITSRSAKNHLKIKTDFAIIGIKGTTFIINNDQNSSYVALKEGLIGIASIKEEFRLYKKKVLDEYQAYVKKQQSEFEKFKQQGQEYVMQITKEFDLHAGNVVAFKGNKAVENPLDSQKEFERFEELLK